MGPAPCPAPIPPRRSSIAGPESAAWLQPIAAVLDQIGVRWAVVGAVAALRYRSEPRLTTDLDLLVESHPGLAQAFRDDGFQVEEYADTGEPPHLLLIRGKGVRVDLLIVTVEYQQVALDRSRDGIIAVEDVIVHKLIAWRTRDQDDVLSILRADPHLDAQYIEHWAHEWGVVDRRREALRSR